MQISLNPTSGQFELKAKNATAYLGDEIKIGDYTISGPGEYEVGGIMAEVAGEGMHLLVEDLSIGYLSSSSTSLTEDELEMFGQTDVLFITLDLGSPKLKDRLALIAQIEAPIVILIIDDLVAAAKFCESHDNCELQTGAFKLTRAQLPTEGSTMMVFDKVTV